MALFRYFKREKGNLPDPHGRTQWVYTMGVHNGCGLSANRVAYRVRAPKMGVVLTQTARHEIFSTK